MWKLLTRLNSPGGNNGSLSVLYFHRVLAKHDPLLPDEPTAETFDAMMGWVQRQFTVIPLAEGVARLRDGSLLAPEPMAMMNVAGAAPDKGAP